MMDVLTVLLLVQLDLRGEILMATVILVNVDANSSCGNYKRARRQFFWLKDLLRMYFKHHKL